MLVLASFGYLDAFILLGYLALMATIGTFAARRKTDAEGYFLAERSMPMWAVALSTVAASLSVATFTGAPQSSFTADLTYLSLNIGGFMAVFIIAFLFVPRFYRAGTITIYGYIDQRFGETARICVSSMFLVGRLLASGARLFFAAIPVCLLLFQSYDPSRRQLIFAILLIGAIGVAYTVAGGIRAVIWTDSMQITIVMGAALLSIFLLLHKIPLSIPEIFNVLSVPAADGASKLRLIDFSTDPAHKFTLWTALVGATCLNLAAYGVDHDMAQRLLTARSALRGGLSLIASQCLSLFVVSLFMIVGLLLYIFYNRPDLMGAAGPSDPLRASMQVYPQFLFEHLPTGLAGLAMAGMLAAAQGSLDSAINAMASSAVSDLYWPIRKRLGLHVESGHKARSPRVAVAAMGALLILFAIWSAFRYDPQKDRILEFALGVMAFAYSGMLGVFLTALLTRRGNTLTVILALIAGVLVTYSFQKTIYPVWSGRLSSMLQSNLPAAISARLPKFPTEISEFWWMPPGVALSFLVCVLGRPRSRRGLAVGDPAPRTSEQAANTAT